MCVHTVCVIAVRMYLNLDSVPLSITTKCNLCIRNVMGGHENSGVLN